MVPASLSELWRNVTANVIARAMAHSTFWLIVLVLGWVVWGFLKYRRSKVLRIESEALLKNANCAVHDLLNAPKSKGVDEIKRGFEVWDSEAADKLEELRRRRICGAWQVDHFKVLNTVEPVRGSSGDVQLDGMIAEKAKRLKDIAKELENRAGRLWPF